MLGYFKYIAQTLGEIKKQIAEVRMDLTKLSAAVAQQTQVTQNVVAFVKTLPTATDQATVDSLADTISANNSSLNGVLPVTPVTPVAGQ